MPESYLVTLSPRDTVPFFLAAGPTPDRIVGLGLGLPQLRARASEASKNIDSCNESQPSNSSRPGMYGKVFPDSATEP
jgi:hypothetical protein